MNREEQWLLQEKYNGLESEAFQADRKRLAAGEPLGYIIGHVPFLDSIIYLDGQPLIPRTETEWWVEQAIAEIKRYVLRYVPKYVPILDLCAGSGAVGVAVAKQVPEAQVDFAEIDPHLLPTIKRNIAVNCDISERYRVIESDLFNSRKDLALGKYDFILSNPPYIDPALDRTEMSVKDFEPDLALYGGRRGLELISRIIAAAPAHLNPHGQLWLEHEPEQPAEIKALGEQHGFSVTTHKDQFGIERYSVLELV